MSYSNGSQRVTLSLVALTAPAVVVSVGGPITLMLAGHDGLSPLLTRVVDTFLTLIVVCVTRILDHTYPGRR